MTESKIVSFKKAFVGKDKKGRDNLALMLDPDQVQNLLTRVAALQDYPRGVKISVTYYEDEKPWGKAISAFAFVDAIQEPGAMYGKGKPQQQGKFVPNTPAQNKSPVTPNATNKARAAAALNTEIE